MYKHTHYHVLQLCGQCSKTVQKATKNQKGFTLIELMVVAMILAILSAIAIPVYKGYNKEAYTQEAYTALSLMSDLCIAKAQKAAATGGSIGAVSAAGATKHFNYTVSVACAASTGQFTATGVDVDGMLGDTLILTVNPSNIPPTKTFSGTLF